MKRKCKTCPFRKDAEKTWRDGGALRARIERDVLTHSSQTCHSTGVAIGKDHDTHLCRGARDLQLQFFCALGLLSAPTDEAWAAKFRELTLT